MKHECDLKITYEFEDSEDAQIRLEKIFEFLFKDVEEDHGNLCRRSPSHSS